MKYSCLAILVGALLVPSAAKAELMGITSGGEGQQSIFLSIQDNKQQRRVENLKSVVARHGGQIRTARFEKAPRGQKGFYYNCVLQSSDKVASVLSSYLGASPITEVSALVTFKSKKSFISKTINNLTFTSPDSGFEGTFSWFKNVFIKDPWKFLKEQYPSDFAEHCKSVKHEGSQMLRIKKSKVTVQLFPKGMRPSETSVFYEFDSDTGDLFFAVEGGEQ